MTFRTEYHVNYYETDAMAVVHHSNYVRWFENGRVDFLHQLGISLNDMTADGFSYPITEVSVKYLEPAHFDDTVIIETIPTALTRAKMEFDYRVIKKGTQELLVTGHTQNVFTSLETGHITRLPEKYYGKLREIMKKVKAEKAQKAAKA